jgi:hypothetical protein
MWILARRVLFLFAAFLSLCAARASMVRGVEVLDQRPGQTVDWENEGGSVVLRYSAPSDGEYDDAIHGNKRLVRGTIRLDAATTVSFYEKPKSPHEFLDSTIVVSRLGRPERTYHIGDLIKDQALTLGFVALFHSKDGKTILVCNYEVGATGGQQGFAILHFSSSGVALGTLPLTLFGKVVVSASHPRATHHTADDEITNVIALGRQISQQPADPKVEESARRFAQVSAHPLAKPARLQP